MFEYARMLEGLGVAACDLGAFAEAMHKALGLTGGYESTWEHLLHAIAEVRTPLNGQPDVLRRALKLADEIDIPGFAGVPPRMKRLAALGYILQRFAGPDQPFYLSVRSLEALFDEVDRRQAGILLKLLTNDGTFEVATKAKGRRATRFWYVGARPDIEPEPEASP